jgi:hypothetical protein
MIFNKEDIIRSVKITLREYRKDVADNLFDENYSKELRYTKEYCGKPMEDLRYVLRTYDRDLYELKEKLTYNLNKVIKQYEEDKK